MLGGGEKHGKECGSRGGEGEGLESRQGECTWGHLKYAAAGRGVWGTPGVLLLPAADAWRTRSCRD